MTYSYYHTKYKNKKEKKIDLILVGGYPPPVGGVTIHIKRLFELCESQNLKCKVLNHLGEGKDPSQANIVEDIIYLKGNKLKKFFKLLNLLISLNYTIVHFHTSKFDTLLPGLPFFILAARNKKKILTIHSGKFISKFSQKWYLRVIIKYLLDRFDYIIPVNQEQKGYLNRNLSLYHQVYDVIPTFIFIRNSQSLKFDEDVQQKLKSFKKRYTILILTTGMFFPHYGYDLLIKMIEDLSINYNIGLIMCLYGGHDKHYRHDLFKKIKSKKFILYFNELADSQFISVLKNVDIYIRPTFVDSVGVVVAEALHYQIPVIASNVCPRPVGTILFRTGDINDLKNKFLYFIKNRTSIKSGLEKLNLSSNGDRIVTLYKQLI